MKKLTIYPTSLALRQWQEGEAEKHGFVDSRWHVSIAQFLGECSDAAQREGLLVEGARTLRPVEDLDKELAIVEAASSFKAKAKPDGVVGRLAATALEEVLFRVIAYVDPLAGRAESFLEILKEDSAKNAELAELYKEYDALLVSRGIGTMARVNAAILELLHKGRDVWPASVRHADRIVFSSLRWVPPFVEMAAEALEKELGKENLIMEHILQEHEQEWWAGDLLSCVGSQIFGDEESSDDWESHNYEETVDAVSKLLGLRESMAVVDPGLAGDLRDRVGFSVSVGVYGEVEDMARRIVCATRRSDNPIEFRDICFATRNMGAYSDAIVDVFNRFGIPYYFRRGLPAMSIAVVKTILSLVELSVTRRRDVFCSLLESPWPDWWGLLSEDDEWIVQPADLADDIRRSGVEPEIEDGSVLESRLRQYYGQSSRFKNPKKRAALAKSVYELVLGDVSRPATLRDAVTNVIARCEELRIKDQLQAWADGAVNLRERSSYALNARAYRALIDILEKLASYGTETPAGGLRWRDVASVVSRAAKNLTVSDPGSNAAGVRILNPYDAAGLRFNMVIVAGLNSGEFPLIPSQNSVFSDSDLERLREKMGAELPRTALAISSARNSQENLLFLSLIASASERMVFSRTSRSDSGENVPASVFYSTLWRLSGWAVDKELPAVPPDPYDQWRLASGCDVFRKHWDLQRTKDQHSRSPFSGESFFSTIPPVLCCAVDEARQAVAAGQSFMKDESDKRENDDAATVICRGLGVESVRSDYFTALMTSDDSGASEMDVNAKRFIGAIDKELWEQMNPRKTDQGVDFGTTALQNLSICPYKYYLSRILGLEQVSTNELEAEATDFGSAYHLVMETASKLLRGDDPWDDAVHGLKEFREKHKDLCVPAWCVESDGSIVFKGRSEIPVKDGIPMVQMDPKDEARYIEFFNGLCDLFREASGEGQFGWKLGAAEQADIEWKKLRSGVLSIVQAEMKAKEGWHEKIFLEDNDEAVPAEIIRCTLLLEHVFDNRERQNPDGPSVQFVEKDSKRTLLVHGMVDRVDLLFDKETSKLCSIMVLDYKGSPSKYDRTAPRHMQEVISGKDCQLGVYGLAAREFIKAKGQKEDVPVVCMYLSYKNGVADQASALRNARWIRLDGLNLPEDKQAELAEAGGTLIDVFTKKLFKCLDIVEKGEFFVNPTDCAYCDFSAACRYSENQLGAEESDDS